MYAISSATWSCLQQAGVCSQQLSQGASYKPFTSSQAIQSDKLCHRLCQHSRRPHQQTQFQTQCVAPNTQSVGRRVVGSVATAAFLTWALRSASAKSMKPGDVQQRSRDEDNAVFENREGEVTTMLNSTTCFLSSGFVISFSQIMPNSIVVSVFDTSLQGISACCRFITQMLNGNLCSVQGSTECCGNQALSYHSAVP